MQLGGKVLMFVDENRASTTPPQISTEEQYQTGMAPEMIRPGTGIEHGDAIIADLKHCEGRL
jgi:O-acetylhomoserine/O-acetylserine sulfhydrylase-like pyridoxal-dependent enzyme